MTHQSLTASSVYLWLRIAATIAGWVLIVTFVHRLAHMYQPEVVGVLKSPLLQVLAAVMVITVLFYLVALSLPFVPNPGLRTMAMVFFWVMLLVAGHSLSHMGFHDAQVMLSTMREAVGPLTIVLLGIAYAVALAMPFVPGVELGLLIMAAFGPLGALIAYLATIGGLSLAHAIGRTLPEPIVVKFLKRIGIEVPHDGVASAMQGMVTESRLGRTAPKRLATWLIEFRYLTLGLCLNFPGNSVLGGGGGLALLCGMSRQFRWRAFLVTVAVATSPVPILVVVGWLNIDPFMEHQGFAHDVLTVIERWFVHD